MIKSIKAILAQDKEKFKVPRKVQDLIPIKNIWPDGIFKVGNKFSKSFRFSDINYLVASREDKESMFLTYSELLNSLDSGATTKITINDHRLNRSDFEESILMPMKQDGLDEYRKEYNDMLLDKATGANGITQEKYITITVAKKDIEEARAYFARIGADLTAHFANLGSKCVPLNAVERLRILHNFYRPGDEVAFSFDMNRKACLGHDFRDYICPDSIERTADHIKLGEKYARVLFLKDYASYIKDSMFSELTELNRNLMLSIDVIPVPTDEAVREVERLLLGVETNITGWQRRQNQNNNFSAVVPYDMELQRKESKEFLDDLTTRDQRMMFAVVTMVITADTKEQLDLDTETVLSTARKHMCQMATLKYQQTDGLNTVLPIGTRKINGFRTLTTESLAVLMPFKVQEIMDKGGIYFGENAISHNLIMCNKANLLNQSAFLLGVPGSGKSFSAKELITFLILNTNDDIMICDPEGEYAPLIEAMGGLGSVIRVSAGGRDRLNAMYMEFANITEYAHFVSNHFDAAIQRYSESRSVMERGNDVWSNAAVLRHLDEQVYTANRDVHTLLKIYYPEYAKDRHFLSYPIGQFFSAIYRLWDYENSKIIFDVNAIKECLSSNILSVAPGEVLLRTFYNVEILFENVTTYGFRVLAGCRAFLLPHQISTVARCFETTPVRYMLADEVGLGKTVEACSVLSILASENKDLRVLIVVPGALASQWKNELHYKYGLNADINSPRSRI